jgi:hypothetical protein
MACEYTQQSRAVQPLTLNSKTDVTKSYIDWAIQNEFSVIDVNVPQIVAVESEEVIRLNLICTTKANQTKV